MRPLKLSSNVFLELPPVLSHYVETDRHLWVEGNPKRGKLSVAKRAGLFEDLESLAVERRHLLQILGPKRLRSLRYRTGFEQGRRDARRHMQTFGENARLALQAALVFGQLQGRYVADNRIFSFDLEAGELYREIRLESNADAYVNRIAGLEGEFCTCAQVLGYLSGHVSEILGKRVLSSESECAARGDAHCVIVTKLDGEWGEELNWQRTALDMESVEIELRKRDELVQQAQKAARKAQASLGGLNRRVRSDLALDTMVADSDEMRKAISRSRQFMESDGPVLIVGETGTGKETFARAIHAGSARKKKPFLTVDCIGLPPKLLAQELFGYTPEGVPGTLQGHVGVLVRANGGTVFLNEITKMPLDLQAELAEVLQTERVTPIGGGKAAKTNFRAIAGTQFTPQDAMRKKQLRDELFYTLAISRIDVPPLRDRESDVLRLAEEFFRAFKAKHDRTDLSMSGEFKQHLIDCSWPGNVSQLRNVMEHAVLMAQDGVLQVSDLPQEVLASRWTRQPQELTEEVIAATLSLTKNNRSKAAEMLGIGRTTLWRSMKRLGIE